MTSIDVNVKTIDHSALYLPPSRTIEIKTSKGNILTPVRASTSYEFKKKAQVPTDIPIDTEISINVQKLNYKNLQSLLTTNGYLENLSRKIDLNNRLEQYSKLRISLLQPTSSEARDPKSKNVIYPSGMTFLQQNPTELNKFIRILINTQHLMGLDLIAIPFLDLPLEVMKSTILNVGKSVEKINREPFFVIDMKYPRFSEVIELLVENLQSKIIGLIFRDYLKCVQSYEALAKYDDHDVAFFSLQVDRIDLERDNLSTMHYLPFLGNDIYSVVIPGPFIPSPSDKNSTEDRVSSVHNLRNIRIFDKRSLQVNEIRSYEHLDEKISSEYKDDNIIQVMLKNFAEAETDNRKYGMLNAFSRVDELKSSLSEFNNLQRYIKQESSKDYLQEKETLEKALRPMSHPASV